MSGDYHVVTILLRFQVKFVNDLVNLGCGGGLVVSALAYCSEDLSSNPADY